MYLILVLSAFLFFGLLTLIAVRLSSGPTDILMLFVLAVGLFYGFRPLLILAGLDTPFPDRFFNLETVDQLAATTLLWLSLFLACFAVGAYVVTALIRPPGSLFFAAHEPNPRRMVLASVVLTGTAALISAALLARYGGIGPLIAAVKVDKDLAGLYVLKVPAAIGAIVSVATFLQLRRRADGRSGRGASLVLVCGVLNGFFVFLWGQRSALVVVGVMLLLGTALRSGSRARVPTGKVVARLLLAAVIVVSVSAGLRVARDTFTRGEVQDVVANATVWRQMSLATNSIYFDSSMLAFRDWPDRYQYREGEDFILGVQGVVPRLLWEGKPKAIVAGKWFRQVYQPGTVNGWPVGAPTLWYLNFGPLGVILGGLLSGFALGWLSMAQRRSAAVGLNIGIALVLAVYVFQLGWSAEMPLYFGTWMVPLTAVVMFVTGGRAASGEQRSGRTGTAPVEPVLVTPSMTTDRSRA